MNTIDDMRYVLVESFPKGDAQFVGRWLLAAHQADEIWREAAKDAEFYENVNRIELAEEFRFTFSALDFLAKLPNETSTLKFRVDDCDIGEPFAVMAPLGFFIATGQRYQMAIPTKLTPECVKRALLQLVRTEDDKFFLHPELLVRTMSLPEAELWERRLASMDENIRCADRGVLLGEHDHIVLQDDLTWRPKRTFQFVISFRI